MTSENKKNIFHCSENNFYSENTVNEKKITHISQHFIYKYIVYRIIKKNTAKNIKLRIVSNLQKKTDHYKLFSVLRVITQLLTLAFEVFWYIFMCEVIYSYQYWTTSSPLHLPSIQQSIFNDVCKRFIFIITRTWHFYLSGVHKYIILSYVFLIFFS